LQLRISIKNSDVSSGIIVDPLEVVISPIYLDPDMALCGFRDLLSKPNLP
jgi:hypothetical protein